MTYRNRAWIQFCSFICFYLIANIFFSENEVINQKMANEIFIPAEEEFVITQGTGELLYDLMKKHSTGNKVSQVCIYNFFFLFYGYMILYSM